MTASFEAGCSHVLEGANGSGKSTLLSVLGGRSVPSAGRVVLTMRGVQLSGRGLRERTGWLGHELGLYGDLTAEQNVSLHARLRGLDPAAAWLQFAEPLGIERTKHRRVRDLSRGQRQRVALARALVGNPAVVLLDEPSTGLDAGGVSRLVAVLRQLAAEGRVLVVVSHDGSFCDELAGVRWKLAGGMLGRVGEQRDGNRP